ncbi:hypothetical protein CBR_g50830, partial [Chara braunii]
KTPFPLITRPEDLRALVEKCRRQASGMEEPVNEVAANDTASQMEGMKGLQEGTIAPPTPVPDTGLNVRRPADSDNGPTNACLNATMPHAGPDGGLNAKPSPGSKAVSRTVAGSKTSQAAASGPGGPKAGANLERTQAGRPGTSGKLSFPGGMSKTGVGSSKQAALQALAARIHAATTTSKTSMKLSQGSPPPSLANP